MIFSIFDMNLSAGEALLVLLVLMLIYLVSLSLHEFAHAFAAYKCGDLTPKFAGRLTLNPVRHIDFFGFLCFMLAGIGWAKPVPINPLNFKKYRKGIAIVSISGVLANFILMIFGAFMFVLLDSTVGSINLIMTLIILFFQGLMEINAFLIIFNLLPIYPLDGFNFISSFMKSNNKFIDFNVRNGYKIFLAIVLIDLFVGLFTGISLISFVLTSVSRYLYLPFKLLFELIF